MRKTELLIPAGSLDVLKTAVVYGADAVYIGGEAFGLRAKAHNFSNEEMKQGIAFAHARGVKVYVTANILAHNGDLPGVEAYFEEMRDVAPDALIISDPGVFAIARRVLPHMEIHIAPRPTTPITGPICSGMDWGQGGWCPQGSCLWRKSGKSGTTFPRICR